MPLYLRYIVVGISSSLATLAVCALVALGFARVYPDQIRMFIGPEAVEEIAIAEEETVVTAVQKANPAVVAITISKDVPIYERYIEQVPSPWSSWFGGGFSFSVPRVREMGTERRDVGGGSGFLVSPDGYIVTNKHVVADEEAIYTVYLNDGKEFPAKVVAVDTSLDIAVIKVDGFDLPYLTYGDSNELEVGQTVIAIGNALAEFRNTVSVGVVSGLSRSIVARNAFGGDAEALDQLVQTDAAINQGNSGGPLIDLAGNVIGVNVAVASGAENIGFALSANSVRAITDSVQEHGRIVRPFLGVRYVPITPELAKERSLTVSYGALIISGTEDGGPAIVPGSSAEAAGLAVNDIILSIDGVQIDEKNDLASILRTKKVGDSVLLKLYRGESEIDTSVILSEAPQP